MSAADILERSPNESALDYHKRIINGKLEDKTLAEYDFSELAKYVYGQNYSSDFARRMMYGSKRTLDLIESSRLDAVDGEDIKADLDMKLIEIQKERQKFFDQRREYQKLIAKDGRFEHLRDTISQAADRLGEKIGVMFPAEYSGDTITENEAVLVFSDWHYGMKTSNIFNNYDTSICKSRVGNVVRRANERIRLHGCKTAHIVILGDLFHGAVHTSARVASEEIVCEQIMHVSEILAQAIYEVSKNVENVYVYMTFGNHARTVQNKKDNIHNDNMERIINWWLIERFKNDNEICVMPVPENEFIVFDVCGHTFCASHGDLDTVRSSPRMFSVLMQKKKGVDLEYILLGDKHHRESFDELGVTSFLCGSLCGADDYANEKRLFSNPSQMLLIVNESCGVDAEYRING